jgi:hypothetical protein
MDTPKNTFLPNGHNAQAGRRDLPLYLPGNGGLLIAVAAMAAATGASCKKRREGVVFSTGVSRTPGSHPSKTVPRPIL